MTTDQIGVLDALEKAARTVVNPEFYDGVSIGRRYDKTDWRVLFKGNPPNDVMLAAHGVIEVFDETRDYSGPDHERMEVTMARSIIAKGLMTAEDFSPEIRDLLT